jgi:hypothetical protein
MTYTMLIYPKYFTPTSPNPCIHTHTLILTHPYAYTYTHTPIQTEVREYFNTEGFNRWNKIYSEVRLDKETRGTLWAKEDMR